MKALWVAMALVGIASVACAQSLQQRVDSAAPGETLTIPAGVYEGTIVINKPLRLIGDGLPTIQGSGKGKVVHIAAEGVTLRGFIIRGSGLALLDDDAAVFVTANRATIEGTQIEDSLHGVYLKKANDCRVLGNRIAGKTTIAQESGSIESGIGRSPENCALVANRRGNGIHLWNCERTEIVGNEISEARDGIYFSFANHTTHLIAEWNNVAQRCLLCREGVIERELDPSNLADELDVLDRRGTGTVPGRRASNGAPSPASLRALADGSPAKCPPTGWEPVPLP